jgi:hypothetical protein
MLALHPANEDLFAGTPPWAIFDGSLREQFYRQVSDRTKKYIEFVPSQVAKSGLGAPGIVLSHPGDKNKGVARMGHPNSVATQNVRINRRAGRRRF